MSHAFALSMPSFLRDDSSAMSKSTAGLHKDERGAVLVTGLFMATFLIGVLWYMVGIGDAVVYHDRMQEAADATAFTSAAVHARGMNFISAINLVMLALVAIHIIMGLIYYVVQAIAIGVAFIPIVGDAAAIALEEGDTEFLEEVWVPYSNDFMKPVLRVLGYVEYGAAVIYPWAGEASGVYVASKYGEVGLSISPSMIPGNALTGGLGKTSLSNPPPGATEVEKPPSFGQALKGSDGKIGLPVEDKKFNALCNVLFGAVADFIIKVIKKIPLVGTVLSLPGIGGIISGAIKKVIQGLGTGLLCNEFGGGEPFPSFDSFWGDKGPKFVWGQAENGNDWMQNWSFVLANGFDDKGSEHRVGMAKGPKGGFTQANTQASGLSIYYAQSEFYFDCEDKWKGDSCNNNNYASWAMRWRARLRRVRPPNVVGDLISYGGSILANGSLEFLKGKLNDKAIFDKVDNLAKKIPGGSFALGWLTKDKGNGQGNGIDKLGEKAMDLLSPKGKAVAAGNPMIH